MTEGTKAIEKALRLLEELANSGTGLSLTGLSQRLSFPLSTTSRILSSLVEMGYVRKSEGVFLVGYGILRLRAMCAEDSVLEQLARPHLMELEAKTGLTTNLAIRDGLRGILIAIVKGSKNLVINNNLGKATPLHASGLGKCLLAFSPLREAEVIGKTLDFTAFTEHTITDEARLKAALSDIRRAGYALDDEEHTSGIRCVAAPINVSHSGRIAAVSVSGLAAQMQDSAIAGLAEDVMAIGRRIADAFQPQ
ncbi:IclR family transcriptional regulator [Candidatus Bipolaricaulota bacterium]|nr:IclR family transcriptional regulator [Candidatus Bipolaricaulota bacterium]